MNTAGWLLTENGRQPWVVQGLLLTKNGNSPSVSLADVAFTLVSSGSSTCSSGSPGHT